MNQEPKLAPIEIPPERLDDETLRNLIESFILREGTDYGSHEVDLDTKVRQVQKQMERGDLKITFDPNTESVTLLTLGEWKRLVRSLSDSSESGI